VTRVGVLTYRRADGSVVRELRHPDHVFRADSLQTLLSAPVCVGHPGAGLEWVNPDNAHQHEVGVVASARADGQFVDAQLSVRRAETIRRIDQKELVEVSAAYDADIDPTPGVWEGQPYDQVQTNITYNHVALLPAGKGRAGRDVRLRADSADAVIEESDSEPKAPEAPDASATKGSGEASPAAMGEKMQLRKVRVDGVEYELPETAASVVDKLVQERETVTTERDAEKKRADSAEAQRDMARADLDKARDPKAVASLVQARVSLEREAAKVLGAEQTFADLTDRQVREKVLAVAQPNFKTEGRSDDGVTAAFEYAIQGAGTTNQGLRLVNAVLGQSQGEQTQRADQQDAIQARLDELEQRNRNAWKGAK
jgi:uncharacterized protein